MFQIIKYLIHRRQIQKAFHFLDSGFFLKALGIFRYLADEKNMDNYFISLNIGRCLSGLKRYKEANTYFHRSFRQFGVNPVPLVGLSRNFLLVGNNILACKYAKKALVLDPIHPFANYYMGLCMISMGKDSLAIPYFERSLTQKKDFFMARNAVFTEKNSFGNFGTELGEF
ncbi:MAG: tetratricopeptide repeat protein [Candidatus Muiribacteriaceae bacterium]